MISLNLCNLKVVSKGKDFIQISAKGVAINSTLDMLATVLQRPKAFFDLLLSIVNSAHEGLVTMVSG